MNEPFRGRGDMYEFFEHTADMGLRVRAAELSTLFAEAARGLFGAMVEHPEQIRCATTFELEVHAQRRDDLLVDWLGELLYQFESRGLVGARFDVRLVDAGLHATVEGEPYDRERHGHGCEIKAITYHGLRLQQETDGWLAEIIFDI